MYTRTTLLRPIHSLCTAFSTNAPLPSLLATFTTTPPPKIHEHGLPRLAPFLGRTFTGRDGITQYFRLISDLLSFQEMQFEDERDWVVDVEAMVVVLRGRARFTWRGTGEVWEETFIYRVVLAEEGGDCDGDCDGGGGGLKVKEYLVWGDTGAAYLARKGELGAGGEGEVEVEI